MPRSEIGRWRPGGGSRLTLDFAKSDRVAPLDVSNGHQLTNRSKCEGPLSANSIDLGAGDGGPKWGTLTRPPSDCTPPSRRETQICRRAPFRDRQGIVADLDAPGTRRGRAPGRPRNK